MANRSPTPTSKNSDFRGPLDDIWGVRGRRFRPIWEPPGGSGRIFRGQLHLSGPLDFSFWGRREKQARNGIRIGILF